MFDSLPGLDASERRRRPSAMGRRPIDGICTPSAETGSNVPRDLDRPKTTSPAPVYGPISPRAYPSYTPIPGRAATDHAATGGPSAPEGWLDRSAVIINILIATNSFPSNGLVSRFVRD